jgi:type I restriction enzyme R subunit
VKESRKYVMRITGDEQQGKAELDNFINPEERYPVIATTSKLMTTGVDAQTCKLIVLDQHIKSMTEFKQIIGRGTRINEDYGKFWFTIMDFKKATELFADPAFDGEPVQIYEPKDEEPPVPPDEPEVGPLDPDGTAVPGGATLAQGWAMASTLAAATQAAARAASSTSSATTSPSSSWPSACSTTARTASSSPSRCATTPAAA